MGMPSVSALLISAFLTRCSMESLAETCVGLAKHISRRLAKQLNYWDESELESVAMVALCHAEKSFDQNRGVKFSDWAGLVIKNSIKTEVYKQRRRKMQSIFVTETLTLGKCSENSDARLDLEIAIKKLPPGQAEAVRAFLSGEKVSNTAQRRGVSTSAGSQQLRLAVQRLRVLFNT